MNERESTKTVGLLRRALPYLTVAIFAAVVYDGWIFYSRWSSARDIERARAEKEAQDARKTLDMLGGGTLKILDFYASPGVIRRGEHANLCFGVNGAKSVRLEPAVEDLHPALSYCLQVAPRQDTEYKLIAEDGAGHSATQSARLKVVP